MRRSLYVVLDLLVILVLLVLSPIFVKACDFDSTYQTCSGTCSSGYSCKLTAPETCSCVQNTPAPTVTLEPGASPTPSATPRPTIGGISCNKPPAGCSSNDYCMVQACGCSSPIACNPAPGSSCTPNCSSICLNGKCYTTNVNPTNDVGCTSNVWTAWQCTSGKTDCAACASQNYQCEYRFCANPPNSNQYQINCGWANCSSSGGGGSNPTNTPTPTAFLRVRLFNPQLTPVTISGVNLCKVNCGTAPCSLVSCQSNLNYYDFPGAAANQGGGLQYSTSQLIVQGITPIQNGSVSTVNSYPACRGSTNTKNCASWSTAINTGSRVLRYIVITTTPTPTPLPAFTKLKNTSFYSNRSLNVAIPATPIAYDADDDASANFIIASPGFDPGLLSATSISLGQGQPICSTG